MKNLTLGFLCLFLSTLSFGQSNKKIRFSLDYSPNWSHVNFEWEGSSSTHKTGHNAFLRAEVAVAQKSRVTFGLGYLNAGNDVEFDLEDAFAERFGLARMKVKYNFNYLVIPVGYKQYIGNFYIHSELSAGMLLEAKGNQTTGYREGFSVNHKYDVADHNPLNRFVAPLMLSVGNDFHFNKLTVSVGVRGYCTLTDMYTSDSSTDANFYGVGLVTGVKF